MLCKRIIASVIVKGGMVVKGKNFVNDRVIGTIPQTFKLFNERWVDEMFLCNIDGFSPEIIGTAAHFNYVPLTYAGGIDSVEHARTAIREGADKVGITWKGDKEIYKQVSDIIGKQSVVCVCNEGYPPDDLCCGEYILQSKTKDGLMQGMDYKDFAVNVPVVLSSGCGSAEDAEKALSIADGVAIGALFAFTRNTPKTIKAYLRNKGVIVR